jgi:hypothetical protein
VNEMTSVLGEELHELIATGRIAEYTRPW